MPFLCCHCNSVFEVKFDMCPGCNATRSIEFYERLCFYCKMGMRLNEYLFDNLSFDEGNIREILTKKNVKKKEQLIMAFHSKDEKVVCEECKKVIRTIRRSSERQKRIEEYCIDIIQRYKTFEKPCKI